MNQNIGQNRANFIEELVALRYYYKIWALDIFYEMTEPK